MIFYDILYLLIDTCIYLHSRINKQCFFAELYGISLQVNKLVIYYFKLRLLQDVNFKNILFLFHVQPPVGWVKPTSCQTGYVSILRILQGTVLQHFKTFFSLIKPFWGNIHFFIILISFS